MKASVIIATYGRDSCLVDTIQSVLLQDYSDFELLVVDQGPSHTSEVEAFLRTVDDSRYSYFLVTPPSLPAARNFGLLKSTGDIVIYIDDDVLLDPSFIQAHVQAYRSSQQIGAIGGRVRCLDESNSASLFRILPDGSWLGGYNYPEKGELETVRGCNMSFRRSVLTEIGLFDPSYEGNALREESDVCYRLRHVGYRIVYEPGASMLHLVAPTGGCREDNLWSSPVYIQNETMFFLKNVGVVTLCRFLVRTFVINVWPYKNSKTFRSRLRSFGRGVARGIRLRFSPKKLMPNIVWELDRVGNPCITVKA